MKKICLIITSIILCIAGPVQAEIHVKLLYDAFNRDTRFAHLDKETARGGTVSVEYSSQLQEDIFFTLGASYLSGKSVANQVNASSRLNDYTYSQVVINGPLLSANALYVWSEMYYLFAGVNYFILDTIDISKQQAGVDIYSKYTGWFGAQFGSGYQISKHLSFESIFEVLGITVLEPLADLKGTKMSASDTYTAYVLGLRLGFRYVF
jgi:hypothetical protein